MFKFYYKLKQYFKFSLLIVSLSNNNFICNIIKPIEKILVFSKFQYFIIFLQYY